MGLRPLADVRARNAGDLRGLNLETVLAVAMQHEGPFTRAELIRATGLSAPTVGTLVSQLMQIGVVSDLGAGPSRGGRRPSSMEFNSRHGYVAGIDLGPTRTRLALADLRGERLADRIMPTPQRLGPQALLARIAGALRALMEETGVPASRLVAVGAGAPGAVDRGRGLVTYAPNLQGWTQVPMRDLLEAALSAPVQVENDVNLAVLGEHWRGAARGHDTCAFVFVGTGIGAGILIGGELHRGHHYMAGEIGVMCMGPQYVDVDYGERGCFETLAGLHGLAERWPQASRQDPAGWVAGLFEAAMSGDRRARKIVDDTARLIAIGVANVAAVVDPTLIVLGGALFAQAESLVHDVRKLVERIYPSPIEIVPSALGKDAPLSGSLLMAANDARERLRHELREARTASAG
jgi:predicted NBD/HSP70 family sugar kinase